MNLKAQNIFFARKSQCPNVSTTPITAMGCRQCLPLSVVQLKSKHCRRKPHCRNGVVDTFEQYMLAKQKYIVTYTYLHIIHIFLIFLDNQLRNTVEEIKNLGLRVILTKRVAAANRGTTDRKLEELYGAIFCKLARK